MADTIKSSNELKMVFGFYDNDTRTVTLDNPKPNLTAAAVKGVAAFAKANNPIIGDKGGASVVGVNSAEVVEKTTTYLDLTIGN